MISKKAGLFIFFLFFVATTPFTFAQSSEKETFTRELMLKSGLNKQIQNTPELLKAAVLKNFKNIAGQSNVNIDTVSERVNSLISTSFRPDIFHSVIASHIKAEMSLKDIKAVIAWLDSMLGIRITQLEEKASSVPAYLERAAVLETLKKKKNYDTRVKLMQELDDHIMATEATMELELDKQILTITAMSSAFPNLNLPSAEALHANFQLYRNDIRRQVASDFLMLSLYTYRNLSDQDIRKYIAFIKTNVGIKYHKIVNEGMGKAYLYCGKTFGEKLGRLMATQAAKSYSEPAVDSYPQKK